MARQTLGSVPTRSFIPKYHRFSFFVRRISGSRALLPFLFDDGTRTMPTSTMLPSFSGIPRSAR